MDGRPELSQQSAVFRVGLSFAGGLDGTEQIQAVPGPGGCDVEQSSVLQALAPFFNVGDELDQVTLVLLPFFLGSASKLVRTRRRPFCSANNARR